MAPSTIDPARLMQGFPPPPEYQVHVGNWQAWPQKIWSFQHVDELFPTRRIRRGSACRPWSYNLRPLDHLRVDLPGEPTLSWSEMLSHTHTDAWVVVHRDQIIDERYFNGMAASSRHLMFSATKSMVGLMALTLVHEGVMAAQSSVDQWLPELTGSAWERASVQQVMDMTDGVVFTEDYADPRSDIFRYVGAMGWVPQLKTPDSPTGIQSMLATLRHRHPEPRGTAFRYRSPATDVTAWAAMRAAGRSLTAWLEERIWRHLGMEQDALVMLDPTGTEVTFAGMSATPRDLARLGQMLLQRGLWDGQRLLPEGVVSDLIRGGSVEAFAVDGRTTRQGWSYRSQWWVNPRSPRSFAAIGAFGQSLYVYPDHELVIVKLGSHPSPLAAQVDPVHHRAHAVLIDELTR